MSKIKIMNWKKNQGREKETINCSRYTSRDYLIKNDTPNEVSYTNNDFDMKDIITTKFTIINCVEIEDLKWYLFKKNNRSLIKNIVKECDLFLIKNLVIELKQFLHPFLIHL